MRKEKELKATFDEKWGKVFDRLETSPGQNVSEESVSGLGRARVSQEGSKYSS